MYPTTVNVLPPSTNFCPETPTKPVAVGEDGAEVVLEADVDDWLVVEETLVGGGVETLDGALVAVPGRHWE